jgi:hypothetical protein
MAVLNYWYTVMAVNIESLTDQSIELKGRLKDALAAATGQPVALINVLKAKRPSGVSVRPVEFVLGGSQTVTFLIRQGGDVYRVQINGKDFPLTGDVTLSNEKYQKQSFDLALKQIGDAIRTGQKAFDKKQERQKVVIPKDPNKATPKNTTQQLKQAQQLEAELLETIATKTQQRDDLKARVEQKRNQAA